MDLMNLLRSVEALLFELVSWLVFYPMTLWRSIRHPLATMDYAEVQLKQPAEGQYPDTLSPPLFLFLTLFIAHLTGAAFGSGQHIIAGPLQDERSLLLFQAVLFSLVPLLAALQKVRIAGQSLTRASLRPAFYSQCYLAAPFVLAFDLACVFGPSGGLPALITLTAAMAGLGWYLVALTSWFRHQRRSSLIRAVTTTLVTILVAIIIMLSVAYLVAIGMGPGAIG